MTSQRPLCRSAICCEPTVYSKLRWKRRAKSDPHNRAALKSVCAASREQAESAVLTHYRGRGLKLIRLKRKEENENSVGENPPLMLHICNRPIALSCLIVAGSLG